MTLRVYQARMVAQGSVLLGCFAWLASASLTPKPDPSTFNVRVRGAATRYSARRARARK